MTNQGDPYRILGITAGASLNEIRSAYRRLAKQYHPDAAGERALPRFLAIRAAYERLVDGEGRLRRGATSAGRPAAEPADVAREPWRADPARARASRDAWRARRSASRDRRAGDDAADHVAGDATGDVPGGAGHATGDAGGASSPGGGHARSRSGGAGRRTRDAGGAGAGQTDGTGRGERAGRRAPRGPRKASPGSTTYDEAAETPLDPEWGGGAWYGPSSGTYWTINPREYADPRKHGPEYQARARRAAGDEATVGEAPDMAAMGGPAAEADATGERVELRWEGAGRTTTARGEAGWATGSWAYDPADPRANPAAPAGAAIGASATEAGDRRREHSARPAPRVATAPGAGDAAATSGAAGTAGAPDLEALVRRASPRNLLALGRRPDPRWRFLLALIGWPPIGYAVGTLLATMTGCASYAASCTDPLPLLPIAAQPIVIAALFLVVPVAATAAFASLASFAVALPVTAVFSVGAGPESRVGAPVLGVAVAVAYLAAVVGAAGSTWRIRPGDDRSPP